MPVSGGIHGSVSLGGLKLAYILICLCEFGDGNFVPTIYFSFTFAKNHKKQHLFMEHGKYMHPDFLVALKMMC